MWKIADGTFRLDGRKRGKKFLWLINIMVAIEYFNVFPPFIVKYRVYLLLAPGKRNQMTFSLLTSNSQSLIIILYKNPLIKKERMKY